ncbi:MAG: type III-B CRISPR module-associated Cmr3 family protein [Bacteroidota bacterium]
MIKLNVMFKPIEHYFFGTENRRDDGTQNYFLYSLPYPQQTTILGAMRYLTLLAYHSKNLSKKLLDTNGNILNKALARKLIGGNGFLMDYKGKYGKIESISELMIYTGDDILLPSEPRKEFGISYLFDKIVGDSFQNGKLNKNIPRFEGYNPKEPEKSGWISSSGEFFENGKLFISSIRPGNKKNNKGENDDDAFYKQEYYQLSESKFHFLIQMFIKKDIEESLIGKHTMTLGGEKSKFIIEISPTDDNRIKIPSLKEREIFYQPNKNFIKVVLTSDAYFSNDPYKDSLSASTKTIQFRFLKSTLKDTVNHSNRGKSNEGLIESSLYNMIERGSSFYFNSNEQFEKWKTDSGIGSQSLMNIGYNQFTIVKPKSK